jgi:nitroreductase
MIEFHREERKAILKKHPVNPLDYRSSEYSLDPIFLPRWSPRAMCGDPLDHALLLLCFEAARWAPSAGNRQERLFLYAHRGTEAFEQFFNLLDAGNQEWNKNASVLIIALSDTLSIQGKFIPTHAHDTGLAVENLLLQACDLDLVAHPMAGFSGDRARVDLNIPERYQPQCMISLGIPGEVNELSEFNQSREIPSQRKPLDEIIHEGGFDSKN